VSTEVDGDDFDDDNKVKIQTMIKSAKTMSTGHEMMMTWIEIQTPTTGAKKDLK
jgi:hypothetical protein